MSASAVSGDDQVLDFEWNVFEQALDWYNLPSQQDVPPEASTSSPETISSYFALDYDTFLSSNDARPPSSKASQDVKKSAPSRSRRQTQNREAQRAFRIRQRQRLEDLESELDSLRSKHESLQEKYASLHLLYMHRADFDGATWAAGSPGREESDFRTSQQFMKKESEGMQNLKLQQADVAAWLAATSQDN